MEYEIQTSNGTFEIVSSKRASEAVAQAVAHNARVVGAGGYSVDVNKKLAAGRSVKFGNDWYDEIREHRVNKTTPQLKTKYPLTYGGNAFPGSNHDNY